MKAVQAKDPGLAGTLTGMRRTGRLFALGVLVVLLAAAVEGHQRRAYTGRRVADVLRELQSEQLRIIFSSDLVPPTLVVKAEPKPASPREIARQILASHGLTLAPGPRGRLLVVALTAAAPPASESSADQSPEMPTASERADGIRIEERVEVTDRLESDAAEPGVYTLEPAEIRRRPADWTM